jgi:hypothetical protein
MALIKIQQSQMSGTLAGDVSDTVADLLADNRTLADDLNALRTQIRVIQGTGAWTDALSGTQDLAEIYEAMHASGSNALFQGDVNVAADLFVSGAAEVSGTITSFGGFSGSLTKLSDGSDYILEGKNISTVTGALGSIEIIANPGAVENGVQYNVDGYFTANANFMFDGDNVFLSGTLANGNGSIATGLSSHAEGNNTIAFGQNSHAEGNNAKTGAADYDGNWSGGNSAHAEGDQTNAFGIASHAEGYGTKAGASGSAGWSGGNYAHAEGYNTTAFGGSSHTEGTNTKTGVMGADDVWSGGLSAHAEGEDTIAFGDGSHAEGYDTKTGASGSAGWSGGLYAHAEGYSTTAFGSYSHAEGFQTVAIGQDSHAEGSQTKAGAYYIILNTADGGGTFTANGDVSALFYSGITFFNSNDNIIYSFGVNSAVYDEETDVTTITTSEGAGFGEAMGSALSSDPLWSGAPGSNVLGTSAKAEGQNSWAIDDTSHAEGWYTIAMWRSHSEGESTYAGGKYSHAEGSQTKALGEASHAEGNSTIAFGERSHAEGNDTLSSGSYSHSEGSQTEASGEAAHSEGWASLASGAHSHAEGYGTEAVGVGSHAEGSGSVAFGEYSHAEGEASLASGSYSHAEGQGTIASGSHSHAQGFGTIARGMWSHAAGSGSFANGEGAHAEGKDVTASGDYSFAGGFLSEAAGDASFAFGSGSIAVSDFSFAVGAGTIASGSAQFAAGMFNKSLNADSLFVIGNGSDDENRNDIFLVNNASVMVGSASVASDVFFYVGTQDSADIALFDAEIYASGTVSALGGFTGSLTKLMDGSDYLRAGVGITLSTGSSGEVYVAANSNSVAKGNFAGDAAEINTGTNVLTFSSIGTLNVADWKHVDVYLNGAYLSYGAGRDISDVTTTSIKIDEAIVDSLVPGDIVTVTLRNIV